MNYNYIQLIDTKTLPAAESIRQHCSLISLLAVMVCLVKSM